MARQTYRNVVGDVRSLVIDRPAAIFKDDALLAFINLALRRTFHKLAHSDYEFTNTYADLNLNAGNITALDWTTSPALPDDLIVPQKLYEADLGATDDMLSDMNYAERLAWRTQDVRLIDWTWQGGQIRMIGSTTTARIRIEYARYPTSVSDLSQSLFLPASQDALAYGTAYYCAVSRGSLDQANAMKADWDEAIEAMVNTTIKAHQEVGSRRKAYSSQPVVGGGRYA